MCRSPRGVFAAVAVLLALAAGCDGTLPVPAANSSANPPDRRGELRYTSAPASDTLFIGTFNIQVFGEAKMSKPHVVEVLVDVARRFDVLAIQEVRSVNPAIVDDFVRQINANGGRFAYLLGPRLGRTSSKEQYLYVYNRDRVEVDRSACYTVEDPDDWLHREPLVARFRAIPWSPNERPFTFSLVNIHTDPDEVAQEINVLDDVFRAVQRDGSGEDDIILLGDFNASPDRFGELRMVPNLLWVIDGQPTNTRRTACYDNIVFDRRATAEFTGSAGVLDLEFEYELTREQALDVSDHLPVWAEFSRLEAEERDVAGRRTSARY